MNGFLMDLNYRIFITDYKASWDIICQVKSHWLKLFWSYQQKPLRYILGHPVCKLQNFPTKGKVQSIK